MLTVAFTTVPPLHMIFFSKNNITIGRIVKIIFCIVFFATISLTKKTHTTNLESSDKLLYFVSNKMRNKMNVHKQKTIINFHTFGRN